MKIPDMAAHITRMVEGYSGWHWFHPGLGTNVDPPAIQRLAEITSPTLILVGGANHDDYFKVADILEKGVLDAKKVIIPGAAHGLTLEKPQVFNEAVMDFLCDVATQ